VATGAVARDRSAFASDDGRFGDICLSSGGLCNETEGDSPNSARYATAKHPSSQKPSIANSSPAGNPMNDLSFISLDHLKLQPNEAGKLCEIGRIAKNIIPSLCTIKCIVSGKPVTLSATNAEEKRTID
jgi:hypothetical protein